MFIKCLITISEFTMITLSNLSIVVTQRCNFRCGHCLRGSARPVDLKLNYIDKLLDQPISVKDITLSGGEPLLRPEICLEVVERFDKAGKFPDYIYLATNGSQDNNKVMTALLEIDKLARINWTGAIMWPEDSVNEYETPFKVQISRSVWHEMFLDNFDLAKSRLLSLTFVIKDRRYYKQPLKIGRAENIYGARQYCAETICVDEDGLVITTLTLTAGGWIIEDCNHPWREEKKRRLCRVEDLADFIKEKIKKKEK